MRSAKQKDVSSSLALDQNFFVHVISALWDFFAIFLMSPKGFFLFCRRMDVQKIAKAPFHIFRHYATYGDFKKISEHFFLMRVPISVFFRHCATFDFFHQRVPPSIFLTICDKMHEKSQSVPPWRANSAQLSGFGVL